MVLTKSIERPDRIARNQRSCTLVPIPMSCLGKEVMETQGNTCVQPGIQEEHALYYEADVGGKRVMWPEVD